MRGLEARQRLEARRGLVEMRYDAGLEQSPGEEWQGEVRARRDAIPGEARNRGRAKSPDEARARDEAQDRGVARARGEARHGVVVMR
jgi:hypothetical protein